MARTNIGISVVSIKFCNVISAVSTGKKWIDAAHVRLECHVRRLNQPQSVSWYYVSHVSNRRKGVTDTETELRSPSTDLL